jgi:hypothetical protein
MKRVSQTGGFLGTLLVRSVFAALVLIMASPCGTSAEIVAQNTADAPLAREAQAAIDKGVLAAREQEWDIAIQSFQEARKTAANSPVVFLNLGLAESKIPGRELRAIAWFGAYLAARPRAPNAAAVQEAIGGLEIKAEGNRNRLVKLVQETAVALPHGGDGWALGDVAALWASAGDMGAAQSALSLIPAGDDQAMKLDSARSHIALALADVAALQAKTGDRSGALASFAAARKVVDTIQKDWPVGDYRSEALAGIADSEINANEIAEARVALQLLPVSSHRYSLRLTHVANAQVAAGDLAGAAETLAEEEIQSDKEDSHLALTTKDDIAMTKIAIGDLQGARQTIASSRALLTALSARKPDYITGYDFATVFFGEAQIGDIVAARQVLADGLKFIEQSEGAGERQREIDVITKDPFGRVRSGVIPRLEAGDIAGAQGLADLILDPATRSYSQDLIAQAQAKIGDIAGAQRTVGAMPDIPGASKKDAAERAIAEIKANPGLVGRWSYWARTPTKSPAPPTVQAITLTDWLNKLDDIYPPNGLNTPPFLDLATFLTRQHSDDPDRLFTTLKTTAESAVKVQNSIGSMLKQQARQQARP